MQHHWFSWLTNKLDALSMYLTGSTFIFGTVTHLTANQVSLFFTVVVGMTTVIYNVVKTRIEINKEKDRKHRQEEEDSEVEGKDED